ncbi:hypothetical protein HPB47_018251 [Ixodes persulcatus]|uniref:Uncharacterized protein n=1 Tax=Ixodes persulcatus TaxID=34615 RepID=A0AC60QL87_IXOPE|nr:hypothetical protein HPB47_018251 [Ixodes persulcatus]
METMDTAAVTANHNAVFQFTTPTLNTPKPETTNNWPALPAIISGPSPSQPHPAPVPQSTANEIKSLLVALLGKASKEEIMEMFLQALDDLSRPEASGNKQTTIEPLFKNTPIFKPNEKESATSSASTPEGNFRQDDSESRKRHAAMAPGTSLSTQAATANTLVSTAATQNSITEDDGPPWSLVQSKKTIKRARYTRKKTTECEGKAQASRQRFTVILRPRTKTDLTTIPRRTLEEAFTKTLGTQSQEISVKLQKESNTISAQTSSEPTAKALLEITGIPVANEEAIPVQAYKTLQDNQIRGVIYEVDEGEDNTSLRDRLRCDTHDIVTARLLGRKGRTAMITFEGNRLPRFVRYALCITPVYPYRAKAVTCTNCHGAGHKQDICHKETVCSLCGKHHEETQDDQGNSNPCPNPTPYCQICKKKWPLCDKQCLPEEDRDREVTEGEGKEARETQSRIPEEEGGTTTAAAATSIKSDPTPTDARKDLR